MPKIKYNKEEFEANVKKLAEKHNIPEEVAREWLQENFDNVEKAYREKMKKVAKEALEAEK